MERLAAELETRFALPVDSPWLKQRYDNLKLTQEELKKVEDGHLKFSVENEARDIRIETLRNRRDFLEKLLKSLKSGKKIQKTSKKAAEGMEQKGKKQIHHLEDQIEMKQKNNKKLKKLIKEEKDKIKILKEQGSLLKQSEAELKIRLSQIELDRTEMEVTFTNDEKTIQEMETFFFKMTSDLFQLQREINKMDFNFLLNPMSSAEDQSEILTGFHKISHLLDDMGKEQRKFVLQRRDSGPVTKKKFLTEEENKWFNREFQNQKINNKNLKLEKDQLIGKINNIQHKFLVTVNEIQKLLENYAEIESKNMAVELRNTRLKIMGKAIKFEPEYPMYQKYNQTKNESNLILAKNDEEYQKLYEKKQKFVVFVLEDFKKSENKLKTTKNDLKEKFLSFKKISKFVLNEAFLDSIKKLNPTVLHTVLTKGTNYTSSEDLLRFQHSEAVRSRITEYFKKLTSKRKKLYESHLQKSLKILESDLKQIKDEISVLENSVWGLQKAISESEAKRQTEEEAVQRLEARLKIIKTELEKKKNEQKQKKTKSNEKWIQEAAEVEEKLIQMKAEKEALRIQKCSLMESLRQARIDENNLRHRLNVYEALQKAKKQGVKEHESMKAAIDAEKEKTEKLEQDLGKLRIFLTEARLQEQNLESDAEKQRFLKIKEEKEILEAEKTELQKELDHLTLLIDKLIMNSDRE